jgi:hypothetical protein
VHLTGEEGVVTSTTESDKGGYYLNYWELPRVGEDRWGLVYALNAQ